MVLNVGGKVAEVTYVTITGEESGANGITTFNSPQTYSRPKVPDLDTTIGSTTDHLIVRGNTE